jgi:hypothetical protein
MANLQELKKLKELLDSGVLTQEEFDAQKKILLSEEQPKISDTPQIPQANTYIPQQPGQYVPPQNQLLNDNSTVQKSKKSSGAVHVILSIIIVIFAFGIVSSIISSEVQSGEGYTTTNSTVANRTTVTTPTTSQTPQTTTQANNRTTTSQVDPETTTQTEITTTQAQTAREEFNPKDVSDSSIKSIVTYNDYLTMYGMIIDDYLDNYQSLFKGTMLYDQSTFDSMKEQYASALEVQKAQYGAMGDSPIVGKDTLVEFLITYRDSLNEYVESMRPIMDLYK